MEHIQYSFVLCMGHTVLSPIFRNMTEEFVLPSVSDVMLRFKSITNDFDKVRKILPLDILRDFLFADN